MKQVLLQNIFQSTNCFINRLCLSSNYNYKQMNKFPSCFYHEYREYLLMLVDLVKVVMLPDPSTKEDSFTLPFLWLLHQWNRNSRILLQITSFQEKSRFLIFIQIFLLSKLYLCSISLSSGVYANEVIDIHYIIWHINTPHGYILPVPSIINNN